ncbi:nucleoside phosphorylase domain-containing protein [Usnea florida]
MESGVDTFDLATVFREVGKDFTVGWICALPLELTAAQGMLDERYEDSDLVRSPRDTNQYTLGQIAGHQIAVTCLVSAGNNHAGSAAIHMQYTFENLRFILMVGIGGGIPNSSTGNDVRLGDVVVSRPSGTSSGVIQYDNGKLLQGKDFLRQGALRPPPQHLQKVVNSLIAKHESEENCIASHIDKMLEKHPGNTRTRTDYRRPGRGNDLLFRAEYVCNTDGRSCADCDPKQLITRQDRLEDKPVIHYGNIASGNSVVRDALKRDQLGKDCAALCVEMEAAGLMDDSECLVIRGICDYADTHKSENWQRYAAATAAAYAKELLGEVRVTPEGTSLRHSSL